MAADSAQPPGPIPAQASWLDIPPDAIPKKEKGLERARVAPPRLSEKLYIDAPVSIVQFYLARPHMAFKIARYLLGKTPLSLEQDEETGEWIARSGGMKYYLIPLAEKASPGLAGFKFAIPLPLARNGWITGHGLLKIHASSSGGEETLILHAARLAMDKDHGPLSGPAEAMAQSQLAGQAESLMDSLKYLSEETADDPETLAEDMGSDEEIFTPQEIAEFRKEFLAKPKPDK